MPGYQFFSTQNIK